MLIKSKTNKSSCKGCGRKILWARLHPSDKPHPLNPGVQFTLTIYEDGEEFYEIDLARHSHFRTCAKADKFRKAVEPASKPVEKQPSLF